MDITPEKPTTDGPTSNEAKVYRRDESGRFALGNIGGGNPYASQIAKCRAAFHGIVNAEMVAKLTMVMAEKALKGENPACAMYLLDRVFGRPTMQVELESPSRTLEQMRLETARAIGGNPAVRAWLFDALKVKAEDYNPQAALDKLAPPSDIEAHRRVVTEIEEPETNTNNVESIEGPVIGSSVLHQPNNGVSS